MEPVGFASGVAGLLSLGITVCQGLLSYYNSWKDADENVARTLDSIGRLAKTLALLRSAIRQRRSDGDMLRHVEDCIGSTEKSIRSLEKKLNKVKFVSSQGEWQGRAKAGMRKALFPFKESTLAKLREICSELRDDLALALSGLHVDVSAISIEKLDLLDQGFENLSKDVVSLKDTSATASVTLDNMSCTIEKTSETVDELVLHANREHTRTLLDWLSPLTVDFEGKHRDTFNLHGRQDGIGRWLLETDEFNEWLESKGQILWCPGRQGTGKTVLVSYLIEFLQSIVNGSDFRLAYIYLDYKESAKQTPAKLLGSLLRQLAASGLPLPINIAASYEAHRAGSTLPSFGECTELLCKIVSDYSKVFIVVDALDECSESSRNMLLKALRLLQPHACILLTSRQLPSIERQLGEATRLEIKAKSDDIEHYLHDRISESEMIKSFVAKDPRLCSNIVSTIAAKAEGMFLQARLHFDALTSKPTLRKLKTALNSLPDELESIYDEAMERVQAQVAEQAKMAMKVLSWVFYASRPMTMLEIQHAISVETDDPNFDEDGVPDEELVLSICTGLAVEEHDYVTLVHYSLQQYFEGKAEVYFPQAHVDILRVCLTYLSFDEFESGPCPTYQLFKRRMQQRPLLRYAVPNWGAHARGDAERLCQDMIMSFLSNDAKTHSSIQVLCVQSMPSQEYLHRFPHHVTPLWMASNYGLTLTALTLIHDGADMTARTTMGDTVLHRAVGSGHYEIVRLLLEKGADLSATDDSGSSPLHLAVSWYPVFVTVTGIYMGNPNQFERHHYQASMLCLLNQGADVNAIDKRGATALHNACYQNQLLSARLLLDHGAMVTIKTCKGVAPLSIAAFYGFEEVVSLLLHYELDNQAEEGILAHASQKAAIQGYDSILRRLIQTPYDHATVDTEGRNLLHLASFGGNVQSIQVLLSHGFSIDALDTQKRSCLHHAAASPKSSEAIHYLLAKGLDPHQEDIDKWTPLHWAVKSNQNENVGALSAATRIIGVQNSSLSGSEPGVSPDMSLKVAEAFIPLPGLLSASRESSMIMAININVTCDGCQMTLYGPRFKCSSCEDFDYCFKCFLSSKISHPSHEFSLYLWRDDLTRILQQEPADVKVELDTLEVVMNKSGQFTSTNFWREWFELHSRHRAQTMTTELRAAPEQTASEKSADGLYSALS